MEIRIPNQPQKNSGPLPILLGATFAGVVTAVVPFGLLIVPALFSFAMCRTKPGWLALFGGVYAALCFWLLPPLYAASLAVLMLGVSFALYFMQTQKMSNPNTLLALAGIALTALYVLACLPGILSGEGAFAPVQNAVGELAAATESALAALPAQPEWMAASLQSYLATLKEFYAMVPTLLVPSLCSVAGVIALSNLLFFRLFMRRRLDAISPMRPFRLWAIPQNISLGLLFLLVASLALMLLGWDYADALLATVNVIVGMPLMLQGLCMIDFLIVRNKKNMTTRRVLIYSVVALTFVYTQSFLMMFGCFDQLFRFRTRASMPPPKLPPDGF